MPKISIDLMGEIMKVILSELKDAGGEARVKDLLNSAPPTSKWRPWTWTG